MLRHLGGVIHHAGMAGIGVMAIRILAGGALSGSEDRSPLGVPKVEPIASGTSYAVDVQAARRLLLLIEAGYAKDLVELALRFSAMPRDISTVLVGTASIAELDHAVATINQGPLPAEAIAMINQLQHGWDIKAAYVRFGWPAARHSAALGRFRPIISRSVLPG
ncbi:MAG: aldo/keto reductase [Roseomonas sp.]|nr:aldo/keto reductase [Roseomonas sp.]MCA3289646.1 aldo/keto reductase [Roseomonas sp.]MCA3293219.1 aldo/keto reductase [Roseomonas sp.]